MFGLITCVVGLLAGCVAAVGGDAVSGGAPELGQRATLSGRIIVKFRAGTDPTNAQFLSNLSAGLGVSLRYLRPLSGDAHLLQAEGFKDAAHYAQIVTQLSRRAEIEYAEADAPMRHHQ